MSLPFHPREEALKASDLALFSLEFTDIVSLFFPDQEIHLAGPLASAESAPDWRAGLEMVRSDLKPVVQTGEKDHLFLPLWQGEALLGVAVITAEDPLFRHASSNDLLEKSRIISRLMLREKELSLDPDTGMPAAPFLERRLRRLGSARNGEQNPIPFALLLVEMYPKARDAARGHAAIVRAASFIESLIGHLAPLCHLGNGIFASLLEQTGEQQAIKLAEMLLPWLKREGFPRVALGISANEEGEEGPAMRLLEQGWQALAVARKRGPFALCSFRWMSDRAAHPLCPPSSKVMAALRRGWREMDRFAVILLHLDQMEERRVVDWQQLLDHPVIRLDDQEAYLVLESSGHHEAEKWCRDFQRRASEHQLSFSIGVALFPHAAYGKRDLPDNCRKALLHTGFFGPGSMTFFSGVSLNISGDIYYNEGDLSRAVREYRAGLRLDPRNVNLLNSLGVALAQMNRYTKAIALFQEALGHDPANFMALFNLGFAFLARGRKSEALHCFEQAAALDERHFDLLLQLGKLYCEAGRYQEAIRVLLQAEATGPVGARDISHGAVYRFLGEAYRGVGDSGRAMAGLQKAVRHNPRDAAALSMLGEMYCLAGEGNEIALSLCRQAVELDDRDWRHWSRLGLVLGVMESYDASLRALKQGLGLCAKSAELRCRLAGVHEKRGRRDLALKACRGALRHDPGNRQALELLARLSA